MPSFTWGSMPLPELTDYYSNRTYYDLLYLSPYVLAGTVISIIGCAAAPMWLRNFEILSSHTFAATAAATLTMLLLLALASDVGTFLGLWNGPLFFLHRNFTFSETIVLAEIFLPSSLLAGAVAVSKRRLLANRAD